VTCPTCGADFQARRPNQVYCSTPCRWKAFEARRPRAKPGKAMLKASDVAPLLGLTTGRIYQMIAAGTLPATRVGRSVRIPRAAWDSWLQEQSREATAQMQARREKSAREPVATAQMRLVESGE